MLQLNISYRYLLYIQNVFLNILSDESYREFFLRTCSGVITLYNDIIRKSNIGITSIKYYLYVIFGHKLEYVLGYHNDIIYWE